MSVFGVRPTLDKRLQPRTPTRAHQLVAALDHAQALAMNETAGSVIRTCVAGDSRYRLAEGPNN